MSIGDRIKELRKALGLTQQEFADKIGIKRNSFANYETGRNTPLDAIIVSICREFNVSESWLRTGEGEMFIPMSRDDQITDFMGNLLKNENDSFKRRFIAALSRLNESEWEVLEKIALDLAEGNKKG